MAFPGHRRRALYFFFFRATPLSLRRSVGIAGALAFAGLVVAACGSDATSASPPSPAAADASIEGSEPQTVSGYTRIRTNGQTTVRVLRLTASALRAVDGGAAGDGGDGGDAGSAELPPYDLAVDGDEGRAAIGVQGFTCEGAKQEIRVDSGAARFIVRYAGDTDSARPLAVSLATDLPSGGYVYLVLSGDSQSPDVAFVQNTPPSSLASGFRATRFANVSGTQEMRVAFPPSTDPFVVMSGVASPAPAALEASDTPRVVSFDFGFSSSAAAVSDGGADAGSAAGAAPTSEFALPPTPAGSLSFVLASRDRLISIDEAGAVSCFQTNPKVTLVNASNWYQNVDVAVDGYRLAQQPAQPPASYSENYFDFPTISLPASPSGAPTGPQLSIRSQAFGTEFGNVTAPPLESGKAYVAFLRDVVTPWSGGTPVQRLTPARAEVDMVWRDASLPPFGGPIGDPSMKCPIGVFNLAQEIPTSARLVAAIVKYPNVTKQELVRFVPPAPGGFAVVDAGEMARGARLWVVASPTDPGLPVPASFEGYLGAAVFCGSTYILSGRWSPDENAESHTASTLEAVFRRRHGLVISILDSNLGRQRYVGLSDDRQRWQNP